MNTISRHKRQTISVLIPTKKRIASLHAVLEALASQSPRIFEIVVVDTNTGQYAVDTYNVVTKFKKITTKYIKAPGSSASEARNIGAHHCTGEIIAFLDDDSIPQAGWARAVHSAALSGDFWFRGNSVDVSKDNSIVHDFYTFYKLLTYQTISPLWSASGGFNGYKFVDRLQAGNFFVHRKTIEQFGKLFDNSTFPFIGEEMDLSWRIQQRGQRILFVPEAITHHLFLRLSFLGFIIYTPFGLGRAVGILSSRESLYYKKIRMMFDTPKKYITLDFFKNLTSVLKRGHREYRKTLKKKQQFPSLFGIIAYLFVTNYILGFMFGRFVFGIGKTIAPDSSKKSSFNVPDGDQNPTRE